MELFGRLSRKIGDNLVQSNIVNAEDDEIYIYGINQILVSILNVSFRFNYRADFRRVF